MDCIAFEEDPQAVCLPVEALRPGQGPRMRILWRAMGVPDRTIFASSVAGMGASDAEDPWGDGTC